MTKITIKHFVNTTLRSKGVDIFNHNGEPVTTKPLYPLYVKITFQRKTTQVKSIIDGYFNSVEEAQIKHGNLMKMEVDMIEHLILVDFAKDKERFDLKGIVKKIAIYEQNILETVFDKMVWNDFKREILKTRSDFMRLLLERNFKISPLIYYKAAIQLLDDSEAIVNLKSNFDDYLLLENLKLINTNELKTFTNWVFGDLKNKFSIKLLEKGVSFQDVARLVNEIDNVFETEISN